MDKIKLKNMISFFLIITSLLFISRLTFALPVEGLRQLSSGVYCTPLDNNVDCRFDSSGDVNIIGEIYINTTGTSYNSSKMNLIINNDCNFILINNNDSEDKIILGSNNDNFNFSKLIINNSNVTFSREEEVFNNFSFLSYVSEVILSNSNLNFIDNLNSNFDIPSTYIENNLLKDTLEESVLLKNNIVFASPEIDFSKTKLNINNNSNLNIDLGLEYNLEYNDWDDPVSEYTSNSECTCRYSVDSFDEIPDVYDPDFVFKVNKFNYDSSYDEEDNLYTCTKQSTPFYSKFLTFLEKGEHSIIFKDIDNNGTIKINSGLSTIHFYNVDDDEISDFNYSSRIILYNFKGNNLPKIISNDGEQIFYLTTCEDYNSSDVPSSKIFDICKMYYVAPQSLNSEDFNLSSGQFEYVPKSCETNFVSPNQQLAGDYVFIDTNKSINPYLFGSIQGDDINYNSQFKDYNLMGIFPPGFISNLDLSQYNYIPKLFVIFKTNPGEIPQLDFLKFYNIVIEFNYNNIDLNLNNAFSIYNN